MATMTEENIQEMIWRADTNEKILVAHTWIQKNVRNEQMRKRLTELCELRASYGNDRNMFELTKTVLQNSSERGERK